MTIIKLKALRGSEKALVALFLVFTIFSFLNLADDTIDFKKMNGSVIFLFLLSPVILMFFHSFIVLSPPRGLMFILLGMAVGTLMEYFGLKYGVVFGGSYVYHMPYPTIFTVPLPVIFFWPVFIYTSYCLVNLFLMSVKKNKPNRLNGNWPLVARLIIGDSLMVMAIDLFMDPLQVLSGNWSWLGKGQYYGIPVGNFIGWFIVAFIASGLFRIFEYCFPRSEDNVSEITRIIPVLGYATLSLFFTITAMRFMMTGLAIFGFIITMIPALISIYLYLNSNYKTLNKAN